jgi:DNA-directed RNA polymerase subunit K/omega
MVDGLHILIQNKTMKPLVIALQEVGIGRER